MTRKGHKLDKFDAPPPVRKPTSTSPWAGYLRCDECGVDAGRACRDMDDLPALEVCEGRVLVGEERKRTVKRDGPSSSYNARYKRKVGQVGEPTYAPCMNCGEQHMLFGRAVAVGHGWCQAPACRAAYKKHARKLGRTTSACVGCGAPCRYKTCGAPGCRRKWKALTPSTDTL
jgi:hypothetical protein